MANELTIGMSLAYDDGVSSDEIVVSGLIDSLTTATFNRAAAFVVSHSADTAIPLGSVSAPSWLAVKNLDANNFVTIKDASAGNIIAKIRAGKCGLIPLPAAATAPYARADTGDVKCDFLIC